MQGFSPQMKASRPRAAKERCSSTASRLSQAGRRPRRCPAGVGAGAESSSSGSGDALHLRKAQLQDFWPLAELHSAVFYPALPDDGWKAGLCRIDRLLALQMNEALERRNVGRASCIVAFDGEAPADTSGSGSDDGGSSGTPTARSSTHSSDAVAAAWRGPKPLLSAARWAAQPEVEPTLGRTYEEAGILGVAQIDSFGDIVPPRTLSASRDGAVGWIKREGICYLSNVAVVPSARRRGLARRLVLEAEALAADWGFRSVSLHCDAANTPAWALYKALGYRRVALEAPWAPYLNGRAPNRCWLMVKRLPAATLAAAAARRGARGEGDGSESEGEEESDGEQEVQRERTAAAGV